MQPKWLRYSEYSRQERGPYLVFVAVQMLIILQAVVRGGWAFLSSGDAALLPPILIAMLFTIIVGVFRHRLGPTRYVRLRLTEMYVAELDRSALNPNRTTDS